MNTNYKLGQEIHQLLLKNNLENPINWQQIDLWNDSKYVKQLEDKLTDFTSHLGLDLSNVSVSNTPNRMVKLFLEDLFWGLDYNNFPDITSDDNSFNYTNPLVSKNIQLKSTCEHHFVAISGYVTVAYIPNKKIIGLGKLNQIVSFFAHRPQIQERLTRQIGTVLQHLLETRDVAVAITARHNCINRCGVSDTGNEILSFDLSGKFLNDETLNSNFHMSLRA
ncbi:MAG TPA: GTP cyclohydrolase I FolE [Aquella sp.]|nr:GTP cyclohydrolase I FolE [Aquella sp.]